MVIPEQYKTDIGTLTNRWVEILGIQYNSTEHTLRIFAIYGDSVQL